MTPPTKTTAPPALTGSEVDGHQRADARRNRGKVLKAARAAFAAHGLDAQMDEIARHAGVGVGTVYRHFPNKEDLLQALADEHFESLADAAREALEVDDPWEGFISFMTYGARVMSDDRGLSEAMGHRPGTCEAAAGQAGLPELTEKLVARAKKSGDLRSDVVASDIPALICGIGRAVQADPNAPTMSWERYLEFILAGLRTPA